MNARRVSISLPAETVRLVEKAAESSGLSISAWLTRAAEYEIRRTSDLRQVEDHVATLGITDAQWAETETIVARTLARAIGRDARRREAVAEVDAYVAALDVSDEVRQKVEAIHRRMLERSQDQGRPGTTSRS